MATSVVSTVQDIDLLDLERWQRDGAPHDWFTALREHAPVWRHPSRGDGPPLWVVSGYDEVVALGRCPHAMSSDGAIGGVAGLGAGDELQRVQDEVGAITGGGVGLLSGEAAMLLTLDPPEHTSYRKVVNRGFTPKVIGLLEERIRSMMAGYLDAVTPGQPFDLVTEVAMPLPMQVIAELIGAPREMHDDLARWSNESVGGTDPEYRTGGAQSELVAVLNLFQAFERICERHADAPAEDLTALLLDAEVDGETLSPIRFKMFLFLLAVAGNETTRNGISHAVLELARNPEQWALLRERPELIPSAVEEVLRFASPVLYFRRNALEPMEVAGAQIDAGDIVSLWYVSANRDERHFDDPQTFDVERSPNHHVTFGGGGPHYCLGASLARLELRIVLEALVERYASVELAGPVDRLRSNFLHGIKHLPVVAR
jgi:cholest-4-en-3-one 26-monooxygenase